MTSALDWKNGYFIGITPRSIPQVNLSQAQVQSLLAMVDMHSGIVTNFLIHPKYLINAKGTTVWLAIYAFLETGHPKELLAAKKQETIVFVPSDIANRSFVDHNNWPDAMLKNYELDLYGHHLFVCPFLFSAEANSPKKMLQSLRAPDGSLEIIAVHEFDEKNPEQLLQNCDVAVKWFRKEHRV